MFVIDLSTVTMLQPTPALSQRDCIFRTLTDTWISFIQQMESKACLKSNISQCPLHAEILLYYVNYMITSSSIVLSGPQQKNKTMNSDLWKFVSACSHNDDPFIIKSSLICIIYAHKIHSNNQAEQLCLQTEHRTPMWWAKYYMFNVIIIQGQV